MWTKGGKKYPLGHSISYEKKGNPPLYLHLSQTNFSSVLYFLVFMVRQKHLKS